ncbi:hypothetical protein [Anaerotignum sp.]
MKDEMNRDEMINFEIGYYVNLMRIKNAEQSTNTELDYQIKVQKNKLSALGVNHGDFEFDK